MLKTLKWVYKLGVKNERRRIAGFLANAQANRYDPFGTDSRRHLLFEKDMNEEQQHEQKFKEAVDAEVVAIIRSMFEPNERYNRGSASVIFPEGDEK